MASSSSPGPSNGDTRHMGQPERRLLPAQGNDEPSEDHIQPSSPSRGDEAKAAAERLLLDAISKADMLAGDNRKGPYKYLSELFHDLSEPSCLCAWHSRKLTRLLRLVRADRCSVQMVLDLEKPLLDFFDRGLNDKDMVTVKDYSFYDAIDFEDEDQIGDIDADLIFLAQFASREKFERWQKSYAGFDAESDDEYAAEDSRSYTTKSPTVEALNAVMDSLNEWRHHIRPVRTKKRRIRKGIAIIFCFGNDDKLYDNGSNEDDVSLDATAEELERLVNTMSTSVNGIKMTLYHLKNVTSSRQQRALIVLLDDIRLQLRQTKSQQRRNDGSPSLVQQDSPPYQRAQALQMRVEEWVKNETEFCAFREEMERQFWKSWRS